MRASQLVHTIRIARQARRPVMLWGKPGVGKTAIYNQAAALDGVDLIDWRLALMDNVDLRGIPSLDKGLTYWNPPGELPRKGAGYLLMDEFPQAAVSTLNAATQLIFGGRLGSYVLPEGWWVCAAGNREEDMAAVSRMPTHVANRFIHLEMEVNVEDWLAWAEERIDPRVIAFIKYRPQLLHVFDPRSKEKAFASPRSWEFMSQMMAQVDDFKNAIVETGWGTAERLELAAGIVGKQAATEFVGFLRILDKLVDIDTLILNPEKTPVPTDAAVLYALVYALAERTNRKNFGAIVTYVDRLSKEFGFLFMKRIDSRNPDLRKSKEFIAWVSKNQKFI